MDAQKTGDYLAALRKAKGLTQQEIADRLGVSNKTVSKWESAAGFPDITVLPALAELYEVTADDILAGETLTEKRRESSAEQVTEQKRRLMVRLRTRFDMCFVLAVALAFIAKLAIPYVSLAALPLSVGLVWVGYILVAHPVRYGLVEADGTLWLNLLRKLFIASAVQWYVLVCMLRLGGLDWENSNFGESPRLRFLYDDWKPAIFLAGVLLLGIAFQLAARRLAGSGVWLLGSYWLALGLWAVLFFVMWKGVDACFDRAAAPWAQKYGEDFMHNVHFDTIWPKAKARRDAEVLPWLYARRAVLAAGGVTGLGLLGWTFCGWKRRKK